MNYTPVNAETFAIWCEKYKEKIAIEKAKNATGFEEKPTGKELFLANRKAFEDLTLDTDEVDDDEEIKIDGDEEFKQDDDEQEEEFKYDRALYDADGLEDEDIDFDD